MHLRNLITCFSLLLAATACSPQKNTTPKPPMIPLKDFFRNPEKAAFQISPSGQYISYLAPWENRMNVFVRKTSGGEATRVTDLKDRDISSYFWKGDRIIYSRDFGGDENFHLFSANPDGSGAKDLTPFDKVRAGMVDNLEDISDTDVLIGMNKRNPEVFDVYRLDIQSGKMNMVAENPGNIGNWITDHEGKIRMATTTDGVNTSLLYRPNEKAPFKTVLTTNFREGISPQFFTFDNQFVYAASNLGRDKSAIVKIDPATGKELEVLYEDPDVDVESLHYSRKRKVLTTITFEKEKVNRKFLDPVIEKIFTRLQTLLPGVEVQITGTDDAENLFIVRATSDTLRGIYYLYNVQTDKLEELANACPWLNPADLTEMKPVSYKSRDGLTIHGYLTLPKGRPAKNLPVVINPHGGPWHRDSWGYNPEVQFLANRGYAIFQVNFRGSTGYGRKFWEASFKQWGLKMQDDVTDGVHWLIDQGIADPKRVGIYGGSYGGYAVLAGLAFTPDLYACGVDYVGVSNLLTFMKTIPPYWKPYLEMMYEQVGHPEKETDMLKAASPVFHADKIKAPLLVVQGAKDPRVNIAESNQIVEALRKRGVEVEYLVKDDEGHGFHNEENRMEFYVTMERFLAKHLHPDK